MTMTQANSIGALAANPVAERTTGSSTSKFRPIAAITAKARQLWRNKVAVELAERACVSVRTAENYLAGDRSMNGNALVRLLQSDAGPAFLEAIIADMPASKQAVWRREFEKAAERAALRARLDELSA